MKKILSLLLIISIFAFVLAGCQSGSTDATTSPTTDATGSATTTDESAAPSEPAESVEPSGNEDSEPQYEPIEIRIAGLKGPTSMGLVHLMESAESGVAKNDYVFSMAAAADEVTPNLLRGELDMAAIPANLASVLYNNTEGQIKLLAVNTLGVIYIVEKGEEISSLQDLKGKTIYATGKGTVPESVLRYLLSQNGIDADNDVTIEWKSEPTEVVAMLQESESGVAMLPQPFVTVAQTQVEGLRIAVDLTKEWDNLQNGSMFITGVLVARREFVEAYPEQVSAFLDEYKQSTEYVNSSVAEAAQLVEKYGIVKAPIAQKAIPYCNITFIEGLDMKDAVGGYLNVLFEQNPKSIGGALPDDDFYYAR